MSTTSAEPSNEDPESDGVALSWTMSRAERDGEDLRKESWNFDLTEFKGAYSLPFLLALKTVLVDRRNRISPQSIHREFGELKILLRRCNQVGGTTTEVPNINKAFLRSLEKVKDSLAKDGLRTLKRYFQYYRSNDAIFAQDLRPEEFPIRRSVLGARGEVIKRILSQALSRAALAQTLTAVEDAYEARRIDIGHYSFAMLAFQVYWRPASYRQLRLMDLTHDKDKSTGQVNWFLDMATAKSRVDNPTRLSVKLTADLGVILKLQQEHVVSRYGHLVAEADLGKLALFPARKITSAGTWVAGYANQNHGMIARGSAFRDTYLIPINKLVRTHLSFNSLRHTVGTQLALSGLSASRIAAVLKHADDQTCQKYVDLFFQGVLDRISDAMQPSFDQHFPIHKDVSDRTISKHDPIPLERAIVSEDLITGRREVTAACGRQSICGYAPLACYDCNRFRPCWDADHSINLDVVNREIAEYEGLGLAMQHEAQKFKHLRNAIRVVITICQLKSQGVEIGENE